MKPVEKVQAPKFASMNLLRTLPDYYGVQGMWQTVREMNDGKQGIRTYRLALDGKTIKFLGAGDNEIEEHPYLIDTAATPNRLETFVSEDAPEMLLKAIYKLEGDTLTLCISKDSQAYPDDFITHPGDERRWLLLQRVVDSTESTLSGQRVIDNILADASGTTGRLDERRAATALVKLADEGDTLGRMWLAHCLHTKRLTFVKDGELAERIAKPVFDDVRQLAENGDYHALFLMGAAFEDGLCEDQDRSQAKTWYLAAAEKGHPWAMHRLSRFLRRDDRYEEAIKWERLASELGYAASINKLGEFYYEGWAVPKDKEQSRHYSEIAARAGFHRAMANLGAGYFIRGNRELDSEFGADKKKVLDALALKWHRRAAEAASPTGMYLLGIRYRAGQVGLDEDDDKGLLWYRRSALAGYKSAIKQLAILGENRRTFQPSPFFGQGGNYFGQVAPQSRFNGPGWNEDQRYEEYKARQRQTEHRQRFNQNVAPGMQFIPRRALGFGP